MTTSDTVTLKEFFNAKLQPIEDGIDRLTEQTKEVQNQMVTKEQYENLIIDLEKFDNRLRALEAVRR